MKSLIELVKAVSLCVLWLLSLGTLPEPETVTIGVLKGNVDDGRREEG